MVSNPKDIVYLHNVLTFYGNSFPDNNLSVSEKERWIEVSPRQLNALADKISLYLLNKGCSAGDRIGILSKVGSPVWMALDKSVLQIGAVVVPIHDGLSDAEAQFIEKDAGLKICFVHGPSIIREPLFECEVIRFDHQNTDDPAWCQWKDPKIDAIPSIAFDGHKLATIIYTSGSTGKPKGVMLSHENILSNVRIAIDLLPICDGEKALSFLPISHIFERMVIYSYLVAGLNITFVDSPKEALKHLRGVRPNYFTAVPRILEKVYERLVERSQEQSWIARKLFNWAIDAGKQYGQDIDKNMVYGIKINLLKWLIFSRWKKALGGCVKGIFVGASALNPQISRVFSATGIKVREGYGMTETSPIISFNRFKSKENRFGTAGKPIPNTSVEIRDQDDDGVGQIWVKGPGVMLGYWNNASLTKQTIQLGWLNTGDIGKWVGEGFLKITDRRKNIFKTSSGKYIYPAAIENKLNQSFFIEHGIVVGFQKPYLIAICLPNFERLEKWCKQNEVHWTAPAYIIHNPEVKNLFEEELARVNSNLKNHERIKDFHLTADEWSIESGVLSSTMKLKRGQLLEKYQKEISEIYEI